MKNPFNSLIKKIETEEVLDYYGKVIELKIKDTSLVSYPSLKFLFDKINEIIDRVNE